MTKYTFTIISLIMITPTMRGGHAGTWVQHITDKLVPTSVPSSMQFASAALSVEQEFHMLEQEISSLDPQMVLNAGAVLIAYELGKKVWNYYSSSDEDFTTSGSDVTHQSVNEKIAAAVKTQKAYTDGKIAAMEEKVSVVSNDLQLLGKKVVENTEKLTLLSALVQGSQQKSGIIQRCDLIETQLSQLQQGHITTLTAGSNNHLEQKVQEKKKSGNLISNALNKLTHHNASSSSSSQSDVSSQGDKHS